MLILLGITLLTYFFMAYFENLAGRTFFVNSVMPVFFWPGDTPNEQRNALLFFSLTVPVVVALAFFLRRLFKHGESKGLSMAVLSLFILFVSILPISYGRYLYDVKAVPLNDPQRMYRLSGIQADISEQGAFEQAAQRAFKGVAVEAIYIFPMAHERQGR